MPDRAPLTARSGKITVEVEIDFLSAPEHTLEAAAQKMSETVRGYLTDDDGTFLNDPVVNENGDEIHPAFDTAVVTAMLALNARHTKQEKHDCGALTDPQPCRYGIRHPDHPERVRTHPYRCTLEPGHPGPHKDQLHCWAFETFDEDLVVTYEPRDLSTCSHCGSYWPCENVTELSECLAAKYTMREVMPSALSGE